MEQEEYFRSTTRLLARTVAAVASALPALPEDASREDLLAATAVVSRALVNLEALKGTPDCRPRLVKCRERLLEIGRALCYLAFTVHSPCGAASEEQVTGELLEFLSVPLRFRLSQSLRSCEGDFEVIGVVWPHDDRRMCFLTSELTLLAGSLADSYPAEALAASALAQRINGLRGEVRRCLAKRTAKMASIKTLRPAAAPSTPANEQAAREPPGSGTLLQLVKSPGGSPEGPPGDQ